METKSTQKSISFALTSITTEEFAIIEENFNGELTNVEISTDLEFGIQKENNLLAIFVKNKVLQLGQPFVILKSGCHFQIEPESFEKCYDEATSHYRFPKGFMTHLAVLSVGTARGILHAKTAGTPYNQFFLPTLNLTEMIKTDIEF